MRFFFVISSFAFSEGSELLTEERKKQEDALHKFRTREANLLIAQAETEASNEKQFDIPRCNLVLRFDPPSTYIKDWLKLIKFLVALTLSAVVKIII